MTGATRVYPRVCGGTSSNSSPCSMISGLSPRVRGNLVGVGGGGGWGGSIPACAGEPIPKPVAVDPGWVYPRVCGGNHADCRKLNMKTRSIPACAGEPVVTDPVPADARVYPRVCGGTDRPARQRAVVRGLSPRVRGNRARGERWHAPMGSIPACAGEPRAICPQYQQPGVYPRVCGGTAASSMFCCRYSGLSPRVRGNRSLSRATVYQ